MKIIFASSECAPFAKTGGLGDVVGALPRFLKKLGHDVRIVIPMYSFIDSDKFGIHLCVNNMSVQMNKEQIICNVNQTTLAENVPVYFIAYNAYFERPNIYHDDDFNDYQDNPKRFTFLSKSVLQLCRELNFKPDIVHANDWHTAILPAYLKKLYKDDPFFSNTASVLTIHNLAYQGRYAGYYFDFTGLGKEDFTSDKFECFTDVNFLKGGIHYADMINTVSRGYAEETKTSHGGYGLDPILNERGGNYIGIQNGADYSHWAPENDTMIPVNYSANNLKGKSLCKKLLQKQLELNQVNETPIIGIISRFVAQKGLYILSECIESIINDMDVQFAILGAGDKQLETYFSDLQTRYYGRIGLFTGYNNQLAHLIEAGSDFFLMPSIYEPSGLNQIYSMKYGTLPIVRATGGLNDTVDNYNQNTGEGTGFKFQESSGKAIYNTIKWAMGTYNNRKSHFNKLMQNAMKQDFSWDEAAREYVWLYNKALANNKLWRLNNP